MKSCIFFGLFYNPIHLAGSSKRILSFANLWVGKAVGLLVLVHVRRSWIRFPVLWSFCSQRLPPIDCILLHSLMLYKSLQPQLSPEDRLEQADSLDMTSVHATLRGTVLWGFTDIGYDPGSYLVTQYSCVQCYLKRLSSLLLESFPQF